MYDFEIAGYFYKMAKIQNIFLNSPYRAKAYYAAAVAIDSYDCYIETMYRDNRLLEIPFVGTKIKKCIEEIIETGKLVELESYEEQYNISDYSLILCHGLSDSMIKRLSELSVESIDCLLHDESRLENIKNQLTKVEYKKLLNFIDSSRDNVNRHLYAHAWCLAQEIRDGLEKMKMVDAVKITGELSWNNEKVSKIDLEIVYNGSWGYLINKIKKDFRVQNVKANKDRKEIIGKTQYGIPFEFKIVDCVKKESIDSWLKFEMKGDLHTHSSWTDGLHSLEEMLQAATMRQYEYLAVTDHSHNMRIAHGLSESQAISQIRQIRKINEKNNIKLLAGIEVDILPDGSLDYCDEVLSQFDFVIAAIHSHLNQNAEVLYERLEKALSNPYVNILAHPTGRLLGRPGVMYCQRAGYDLDVERIVDLCKKYNVVMEVNCFPERFDLNSENIAIAVAKGVDISFGTDAHSIAHLNNLDYASHLTRNMDIAKNRILNTYSYEALLEYFREQKAAVRKEHNFINNSVAPKDFFYYFGNNAEILSGQKTIVGIDLTGSEVKESGVAYLVGNKALCRRIKSDAEIIEFVRNAQPEIVSIDSPLAYPKGRCCPKKDCECAKFGIMRSSERLLRHFGIMVYPCLIDSMVNLTTRGMNLAQVLREQGFNVIESYPGVAQDILMIPRKGKTAEQFFHLKQGLSNFGLVGDLLENSDISHDEVDAITSALVGYFYLNNQYVGLGNKEEDYLIVPRIQDELLKKHIIIGLSGETGAGKTTTADFLRFKYGLGYFRYSQVIEKKYGVTGKEKLQEIGEKIARNPEEQRALTRYMIEEMDPQKSYVIDGLRHYEDYEELKNAFGRDFVFIYIDCGLNNRYKRYNNAHGGSISREKFEGISNHNSECDIYLLRFLSQCQIDNNKGFKDLRAQIDDLIKEYS